VSDIEAQESSWVRHGDNLLVWFFQGPEVDSLAVHVCAAPEARALGNVGTERQMIALEVIGELLGAKRLWSVTGLPGEYPELPRDFMRDFLTTRGWTNSERGTFRDLGVN
jgi:hypothetical protein